MESGRFRNDHLHVARAVSKGLAKMREEDVCTDFDVIVQGKSFRCHRAMLASVSDYFKAMFTSGMTESIQNETNIDTISQESFQLILDLIYEMIPPDEPLQNVSDDGVEELLRVSDMLQMPCLVDVSLAHFARSMAASNCIERRLLGNKLNLKELTEMAWKFIMTNFEMIVSEKAFHEYSYEDFLTIIKDENLIVSTEENVWRAISEWIKFDEEKRQGSIVELLQHCCLTEIDALCLTENIAFNPIVRKNDEASRLIQDAILFRNHPSIHGNIEFKFRKCMKKEQVNVLVGGVEQEDESTECCLKVVNSTNGKLLKSLEYGGPSEDFACCAHRNSLYVSGGNGTHGECLYEFSGTGMSWRKFKRRLPVPLRQHSMVATDGNLFAISGVTDSMLSWTVFQYSLHTHAWARHGDVVTPVKQASAARLDEKIYIIGGLTEDEEEVQVIQEYDISSSSATIICDLPKPCPYSQSLVRQNNIYTLTSNGGVYKLEVPSMKLEVLTTISDFDDVQPFGIALRNNKLTIYCTSATDVEPDIDDAGTEEGKEYDTVLVDLTTGTVQANKTSDLPIVVYGCVSIVLHNNANPNVPPTVPPRNYKI